MNKYRIVLLFLEALFISVTVTGSICPQVVTFPYWMVGYFNAQFDDGLLANETFTLQYGNITFSNGSTGISIMAMPLIKGESFYIFHECVQIHDREPQQRCSLLAPNCNGYTEYVHKAPELVSICPESISAPGLEKKIVERIG